MPQDRFLNSNLLDSCDNESPLLWTAWARSSNSADLFHSYVAGAGNRRLRSDKRMNAGLKRERREPRNRWKDLRRAASTTTPCHRFFCPIQTSHSLRTRIASEHMLRYFRSGAQVLASVGDGERSCQITQSTEHRKAGVHTHQGCTIYKARRSAGNIQSADWVKGKRWQSPS